jgi:hypothetical protein
MNSITRGKQTPIAKIDDKKWTTYHIVDSMFTKSTTFSTILMKLKTSMVKNITWMKIYINKLMKNFNMDESKKWVEMTIIHIV